MTEENINEQKKEENNKVNHNGDETEKLKKELELERQKSEDYLNGWKRAKADYLNLKKEFEKRYSDLVQFANLNLILEILPILDNFKLASKHIPDDHKNMEWVIGMMHIKKQFENILKNLGVEEIKTEGEKFNPEFHEAVAEEKEIRGEVSEKSIEDEKEEDKIKGIIIKEVRPGYTLNGKVIQAAKVIVN